MTGLEVIVIWSYLIVSLGAGVAAAVALIAGSDLPLWTCLWLGGCVASCGLAGVLGSLMES